MQRWRIGLIGCGWAGQQHARALRALGNRAQLCALADVDTALARELAKEWRIPVWTGDYRELLTRPEIDALSLCLPHSLHAPVAILAAQAGKHVLVEKPLATTLQEADAMIAAAQSAGVRLMVAENVRFDPVYRRAVALIQAGALGELFLIRISREHQKHLYMQQRPWFLREAAGGILFSGGIHDFELLRMLGGDIEHVYALTGRKVLPEMSADDTSVVLAGMGNGAAALLTESFSLRTPTPGVQGTVHGSLGSLWLDAERLRLYQSEEDDHPEQVEEIPVAQQDTFEAEWAHFLDCLGSGGEPVTSGRSQRAPLQAVLAAYESLRRGSRVYLAEMDPLA
jgi:predicted dehydrogenase